MNCTHAMILAAGLGTRMRPLSDTMPKPLVGIAGRRLIDYSLDFVRDAQIGHVVINSHYLAPMIADYAATIGDLSLEVLYEPERLETGGGIRNALASLGEAPFVVLNSDAFCLYDAHPLVRMCEAWDDETMDVMMLLQPTQRALGYDGQGDFVVAGSGHLRRRKADESAPYVFTGVQLIHPRAFRDTPGGAFSMNVIYDRHVDEHGRLGRIGHVVHDGDWLHVGDPQALQQAEAFLAAHYLPQDASRRVL